MSRELRELVLSRVFDGPSKKAVMTCLADHDQGNGAWPSIRTIADYTGFNKRTVRRNLLELREPDKGLIKKVEEADPRRLLPTRYKIKAEAIAALPLTKSAERKQERQRRKETAAGSQGGDIVPPPYRGTD